MYNSFPNYAYVFYLKNEQNEIVFYGKNIQDGRKKNAGYIAHTYYSYFTAHHYYFGFGKEDSAQLGDAGQEMLQMIANGENFVSKNYDTLKLYRRYYSLNSGKLQYRDDLMYAQRIKQ
jgi:hypothetical protein